MCTLWLCSITTHIEIVHRETRKNGLAIKTSGGETDSIIQCTGYECVPVSIFTPECGIQVTNNKVHPLYKHIVIT